MSQSTELPPLPYLELPTEQAEEGTVVPHTCYMMCAAFCMAEMVHGVLKKMGVLQLDAQYEAAMACSKGCLEKPSGAWANKASAEAKILQERGQAAVTMGSAADVTPYLDMMWAAVLTTCSYNVADRGAIFDLAVEDEAVAEQISEFSADAVRAAQVCRGMATVFSTASAVCMWGNINPQLMVDAQVQAAIAGL